MTRKRYVCITGAAGFIGPYVVEAFAKRGDIVYAVDAMTYAAKPDTLAVQERAYAPRIHIRPVDVRTLERLPDVDAVIHLAASTHVDNSLNEAQEFVANNVGTTARLLELVRAKSQFGMPHFVHISTDEVYGSIATGVVSEDAPLRPSSPYAASKAAGDLLVQSWAQTYGVPTTILRPGNTFGIGQYPEKLIPKVIRCVQLGRPFPIHGDGSQVRSWLDARDLAKAILHVVDQHLLGVYNVGGNTEASVMQVIHAVVDAMQPERNLTLPLNAQRGFVRLASDDRYAINDSKLRDSGWLPTGDFWRDLPSIVAAERHAWRW